MKKKLSIFLVMTLLIGLLAACGTSDKKEESGTAGKEEKKVLKMATSGDYAPFEYVDTAKSDQIIGFDIDIANALAEKLGYEIKVQDMDFNGLIPALQAKQADFVMAAMTPTDERRKNIDFSDLYYVSKHMIVTKKGSTIKTLEDLKGKKVGVQLASVQEDKAKELAKDLKLNIESRNRIPEIIQELKNGRFDAAIIEDTVAQGYFKKNTDLVGFVIDENAEDNGYAIAFPKGSELTEDFNKALNEMKEDGEIDKLIVKWFDTK